jgi:hypothetical protein
MTGNKGSAREKSSAFPIDRECVVDVPHAPFPFQLQ